MKKRLVNCFYYLDNSNNYIKFKEFTKNILENNQYKYKKYFDYIMIFLVISTIAILIYEVNHKKIPLLINYEYYAIGIFILEWLGRLWVYNDVRKIVIYDYEEALFLEKRYSLYNSFKKIIKEKINFIFSPMSIIDLLAILPAYRPLRVLRILMIFRLFKILRYSSSLKELLSVFIERKLELYTLAILTSIIVFFGSTIIFVYEGAGVNEHIKNYFDAVYWALITISTVGFGDIVPITIEGKFVTLILIVNGILVIAFSTSIVTTALSERMQKIKQNRVRSEVRKLDEYIIICEYTQTAKKLIELLKTLKKKMLVIDKNESNIISAKQDNLLAISGDSTDMDFLKKIGIGKNKASTIITLSNDDASNLSTVLGARVLDEDIEIVSLVNNKEVEEKLKIAGANFIVNTNEISAFVAGEFGGQLVAFEAIDEILLNKNIYAQVDEIEIIEGMNIIGENINNIPFDTYNLTLIGVVEEKSDNFVFNPVNIEYLVKEKDVLIVIGHKQYLKELKSSFLKKV